MTQHMGLMDFSDEEELDEEGVVGYLQLLPPFNGTLGWLTKELKDGEQARDRERERERAMTDMSLTPCYALPYATLVQTVKICV